MGEQVVNGDMPGLITSFNQNGSMFRGDVFADGVGQSQFALFPKAEYYRPQRFWLHWQSGRFGRAEVCFGFEVGHPSSATPGSNTELNEVD